ncbi:MAG: hypothetical protein J6K12_00105 [Clostridia bacterium]|nr:hypothetical protein [Clostridia bacterium]
MLKIFAGLKGSGKTKHLIELVNAAQEKTTGNVVCIEKGTKLIHEINPQTRLVDISEYSIDTAEKLYGFVCGALSANFDITDLFIDSALKICAEDMAGFENFALAVLPILEERNVSFTMTASVEVEKIPESLKKYLV